MAVKFYPISSKASALLTDQAPCYGPPVLDRSNGDSGKAFFNISAQAHDYKLYSGHGFYHLIKNGPGFITHLMTHYTIGTYQTHGLFILLLFTAKLHALGAHVMVSLSLVYPPTFPFAFLQWFT